MQNAGNGGSTQHPTFPVWTVVCKALEMVAAPNLPNMDSAERRPKIPSMHGVRALCRYN